MAAREIITTLVPNGQWLEARAVDVETGIEAVTMGPLTASRADMERLAMQKLRYILAKQGIVAGSESSNPALSQRTGKGLLA